MGMAALGDTFLLNNREINNHLFVIISDPEQDDRRIATANFTSWRADKDQSCIVDAGEHRFLTHRSCIYYGEDRLISLDQYNTLLGSGHVLSHDPVSKTLLGRILDGAKVSPYLPFGKRQILIEQGLIM
jgi:hypothetical protein